MLKRVCDLCGDSFPNAKIKYKYRAKRQWFDWMDSGWNRIELCEDCLTRIIEAKKWGAKKYD